MGETEPRTNYVRRGIGVALGSAPIVLLAASLGVSGHDRLRLLGLVLELLALLVAGLNFYLSFVRGHLRRWRASSLDGFRRVSGIPMFGTALAMIGTLFGFGSVLCAAIGLVAVALDTGGSAWFLIVTWRDASFWDVTSTPRS